MKNKIFPVLQILLNLLCVPIYYLEIFRGVGLGYNPDTGKLFEKYFYHTPLENLKSLDCVFLMYINFILVGIAIFLIVFSLIKKDKKIRKGSYIFTALSLFVCLITIVLASTVARGY